MGGLRSRGGGLEWDVDPGFGAAARAASQFQSEIALVKVAQARASVGQTNALIRCQGFGGLDPVAVVSDPQVKSAVAAVRLDRQLALVLAGFDSVTDGVFNQRLED